MKQNQPYVLLFEKWLTDTKKFSFNLTGEDDKKLQEVLDNIESFFVKQIKDFGIQSLDGTYTQEIVKSEEDEGDEDSPITIKIQSEESICHCYTYSVCSDNEISDDIDKSIQSKIKSLFKTIKLTPEITSEKSSTKKCKIYQLVVKI